MSTIADRAAGKASSDRGMWARERDDLVRGVSGGLLFGVPLLYTMEVWWVGSTTTAPRMFAALGFTFLVVLLLNRTAGFRQTRDVRLVDAASDSVEALAIGLVCAAFVLVLLREVELDTPLGVTLGKIVFEGLPCSLGVALANQFLGGDKEAAEGEGERDRIHATLADVGATTVGAIVIAFNIAPTDEVPTLAAACSPPWLLLIIAATILISYAIVFAAGFSGQQQRMQQQGWFQSPLAETLMTYVVSLLAAVAMLWFFQRFTLDAPWQVWLSNTVVLGLPAAVGGAAGRLAV